MGELYSAAQLPNFPIGGPGVARLATLASLNSAGSGLRLGSALSGNGRKIVDISTVALSAATLSSLVADTYCMSSGGKALQLTSTGAGTASVDLTVSFLLNESNRYIGFWAFKPINAAVSCLRFFLTRDGFANYYNTVIAIQPGLYFYTIPLPIAGTGSPQPLNLSGTSMLPGAITTLRVKDNTWMATGYAPVMANGDSIKIGDIYLDPPALPKAKFCLDFDANSRDVLIPGATQIAGYDKVLRNHSYLSFLKTYGWRGNIGIMTGAVVNAYNNSVTVAQLAQCRDQYGAAVINHTHAHPKYQDCAGATAANGGDIVLGPYGFGLVGATPFTATDTNVSVTPANDLTAIQNDFDQASVLLRKWGFDEGTKHFMLSQGGYDNYVSQALDTFGFRTVRGLISTYVNHPFGLSSLSTISGDPNSPAINRLAVMSVEGVNTQASVDAFIDMVCQRGALGATYTHTFGSNTTAMTSVKQFCEALKIREQAGLCDIATAYEL